MVPMKTVRREMTFLFAHMFIGKSSTGVDFLVHNPKL